MVVEGKRGKHDENPHKTRGGAEERWTKPEGNKDFLLLPDRGQ